MSSQSLKMDLIEKKHGARCFYILESAVNYFPDRISTSIRRNTIVKGRPFFITRNSEHTANLLFKIYTDIVAEGAEIKEIDIDAVEATTKSFCQKISVAPTQCFEYMISSMPQCGKKTAQAIIQQYSSPQKLCQLYQNLDKNERPLYLHHNIKVNNKSLSKTLSQYIAQVFSETNT